MECRDQTTSDISDKSRHAVPTLVAAKGHPVNVNVEARCFIEKIGARRISCVIFFKSGRIIL